MDSPVMRATTPVCCLMISIILCHPVMAQEPMIAPAQQTEPDPFRGAPLSLGDLEQIALGRNPTLAQAAAAVEASRGKALQAGLYPNPTVGNIAEQIG